MSNRIDAHPAAGITVRFYPANPNRHVDVYCGGWRVGSYLTANGVLNAIAKYREEAAVGAARYDAAVAVVCETCGDPLATHTTPYGGVFAFSADWHARNGAAAPSTTKVGA